MYSDENERENTPRVNSARLGDFINKDVRLPCKVLKLDGDRITAEASDGGQVMVTVKAPGNVDVSDTYIEVIGRVTNSSTVQMHVCISMGSDLDMKLVNDTIELIHDPRFFSKMF